MKHAGKNYEYRQVNGLEQYRWWCACSWASPWCFTLAEAADMCQRHETVSEQVRVKRRDHEIVDMVTSGQYGEWSVQHLLDYVERSHG